MEGEFALDFEECHFFVLFLLVRLVFVGLSETGKCMDLNK